MPVLVKIDYTITSPAQIDIKRVDFDRKISADLNRDRQIPPPPTFRSTPPPPGIAPYIVSPINQFIHLWVLGIANTPALGMAFTMTVTFTIVDANFIPIPGLVPFTPPVALGASIDISGKAVLDTSVRWR